MFEALRIAKEVRRIVGELSRSATLPVRPQVIGLLKSHYSKFAGVMRNERYDPNQAAIRLITSLAVYGEKVGANERLQQRDPTLYRDFHNLYRFCQLAYLNEPDRIGAAFCVPQQDSDPKPFEGHSS